MAAAIIAPIVNSRKAAAIQQRINALEAESSDIGRLWRLRRETVSPVNRIATSCW